MQIGLGFLRMWAIKKQSAFWATAYIDLKTDLDAFNVTCIHDRSFEKLHFSKVSLEQRFQLQLRSLAASNTPNQCLMRGFQQYITSVT